jgi:hypothetical protein
MEQQLDATYLRPGPVAWSGAIGLAAVGIGTGILLAAWGVSLLWRYTPPEIEVRIRNPEIHVKQEAPFTVKQDKPFEIQQPGPLKIDPTTVRIEQTPTVGTGGINTTANGEVIKQEVIVFSNVKHDTGTIVTGWKYRDGSGGQPFAQFCYYTAPNVDLSSTRVDIASNRVRLPQVNGALVPDLERGLAKCQWWHG